ncbi:1-phosphofructokinase family hexose kinase [Corynebacterium liangguodongii]|uniref:Carbohydrate kinase PfkB domain-containing protein n=1 Tax=Corynebacterium liangguodongii TaxID=2079535 RepID=A0A2S0WC11_9CORY|nr:PfkB family carbohydrate kinase [Corynebacterium liangguodongii]AWB83307.1 hypothetical protein C3E79_01410 [Corynebacterium liangguodongii]PWC00603.1 hypothetical protein DF219_01540 [Corynebacterium liangguodongii]
MPRVITLTPAPALDVTITADSLRPGHSHRVAPAHRRLGGKGINVANILAQQGFDAQAMGLINERDVREAGGLDPRLALRFTDTDTPLRSTWSIFSVEDGDTAMFNEPAPPFTPEDYDRLAADVRRCATEAELLVVSGSVPANLDPGFLPALLGDVAAGGVDAIVDTQGRSLIDACAQRPLWVKPNHHELAAALGHDDVCAGAQQLLAAGARGVAVSMGADGLLLVTEQRGLHARLDAPVAGNPTGAGDAVVAALAAAHLTGEDLDAAAVRCIAWSAAAVLSPVAGTLPAQWEELSHRVDIREVHTTKGTAQ